MIRTFIKYPVSGGDGSVDPGAHAVVVDVQLVVGSPQAREGGLVARGHAALLDGGFDLAACDRHAPVEAGLEGFDVAVDRPADRLEPDEDAAPVVLVGPRHEVEGALQRLERRGDAVQVAEVVTRVVAGQAVLGVGDQDSLREIVGRCRRLGRASLLQEVGPQCSGRVVAGGRHVGPLVVSTRQPEEGGGQRVLVGDRLDRPVTQLEDGSHP